MLCCGRVAALEAKALDLTMRVQEQLQYVMFDQTQSLRLKIVQKPCIVWSLGPKAFYYESLEP